MNVLMLGPAREVRGGISSIVNYYYDAGLDQDVCLKYIGTMRDGSKATKLVQAIKALMQYVVALPKFDMVHIHLASDASFYRKRIFARIAALCKKKTIVHVHGAEFKEFYAGSKPSIQKSIRAVLDYASVVIALSDSWKAALEEMTSSPVVVLYNCVKAGDITGKVYDQKQVAFFGRLGKRKGTYDLLAVLDDVVGKHEDAFFHLCGDGEVEQCKTIIESIKMTDHADLPGWVGPKDRERILKSSSVYVLPSYNEGLPMSVLEAMAEGVPVISTRTGGIPEMITNGYNGYLIEPGDRDGLKVALNTLLESKELRTRMGRNAYQTICDKFDIKVSVKALNAIYSQVFHETNDKKEVSA